MHFSYSINKRFQRHAVWHPIDTVSKYFYLPFIRTEAKTEPVEIDIGLETESVREDGQRNCIAN